MPALDRTVVGRLTMMVGFGLVRLPVGRAEQALASDGAQAARIRGVPPV